MKDILKLHQIGACQCQRSPHVRDDFRLAGRFKVAHYRNGELLTEFMVPNGIVDEGLNHLLETVFHSGTPITAWKIGLIDSPTFTAFDNADVMNLHTGWTESVAYTEGSRPAWTAGTAATRQITNAATVDFTISAPATIKGLFIVGGTGAGTKTGTTGVLWSTAAFSTPYAVLASDVLKITYTLSG
jgi:hypothetical protein